MSTNPPKSIDDLMALLAWEGQLKNQRIQQALGVSQVYATKLIAAVRREQPGLIEYDLADKCWHLSNPRIFDEMGCPPFSAYSRLRSSRDAHYESVLEISQRVLWPPVNIFRAVHLAITRKQALQLTYRSFSTPRGRKRIIVPHALTNSGPRVHARAWCVEHKEFRDFNLGRMVAPTLIEMPEKAPNSKADTQWNTVAEIVVRSHSGLDDDAAFMVREEYFDGATKMTLQCRLALVQYLLQGLRVATDVKEQKPPVYLLECGNIDQLSEALFRQKD